ncbi:hypothetical protein N7474_001863 [Penicillium riverlandense]|uniref:uncharacterized protein n=1 Tax=Penicillium riverlandense TaxID=1903569 RepID=UPI002549115D|nr:uncharacterized protein N7474_001863 [Penicillium riverlandense]KAJ5833552.1 hypothetical protein N7474_001863 [Penicillium riverlandense]
MFATTSKGTAAVPSRNALRALRRLALTGSAVGSVCAISAINYDVYRRIDVAEKIIENKRLLHSSVPNYDATAAARRLAELMGSAEAGEFMGLASLKDKPKKNTDSPVEGEASISDADIQALIHENVDVDVSSPVPAPLASINWAKKTVAKARRAGPEDSARSPLEQTIHNLIKDNQEIEAAYEFLKKVPEKEPISDKVRETAYFLFAANCMKGNIFIARRLFNRISTVTEVTSEVWATMIHLLAKEGHVESAAFVYDKYKKGLTVPPHLMEIVLRCLIESKRLTAAKWFFFRSIRHDRDCGLCGAYLDGLWRKTRSLELVTNQFRDLIQVLSEIDRKPTEKLFNPVIRALVECGRQEDVVALLKEMSEKHGVEPGCRALGLLAYSKALDCDWEGVMLSLREMHRLGFTQDKRDFTIVFDRVFLEYWPVHTGSQIMEFLMTGLEEFSLSPDKILYRHILEALLEKGTEDMIVEISTLARERKWRAQINEEEFMNIVRVRQKAMEGSPVGFWRMMQAARDRHGKAATSRRILGVDSILDSQDRNKLMPIHTRAETSYGRTMEELVAASKSSNHYVPLETKLEHHIHSGNFESVWKDFQEAHEEGFTKFAPIHTKLVAVALILDKGSEGLLEAQEFIKKEQTYHGMRHHNKVFTSIFLQRILKVDADPYMEGVLLKMAVFEFLRLCCDTPKLHLKCHVVSALSQQLIVNGKPELAIDVLTAYYMSQWRLHLGFNGVLLKLLARAYAATGNLKGVWWCMMAGLSRPKVHQNADFVAECRLLLPLLEDKLPADESAAPETAPTLRKLSVLLDVLQKKSNRDQYWLSFHVNPQTKRKGRLQPPTADNFEKLVRTPNICVEQVIQEFDEEIELEGVLGRTFMPLEKLERVWQESKTTSPRVNRLPEKQHYERIDLESTESASAECI